MASRSPAAFRQRQVLRWALAVSAEASTGEHVIEQFGALEFGLIGGHVAQDAVEFIADHLIVEGDAVSLGVIASQLE